MLEGHQPETQRRRFLRTRALTAATEVARGFYFYPSGHFGEGYTPPDELLIFGSTAADTALGTVGDADLLAIINDPDIQSPEDLDRLVTHTRRFEQIEKAYRARIIDEEPVPMNFLPIPRVYFQNGKIKEAYREVFINPDFLPILLSRDMLRWDRAKRKFISADMRSIIERLSLLVEAPCH